MTIFNSYVRLPEGITTCRVHRGCLSKVTERKQPIVHDTTSTRSQIIFHCPWLYCCQYIWCFSVHSPNTVANIFPIYWIYIPKHYTTDSRQIWCQVSNRYQAVRQIAKGTWSQAQPFLLSACCFKVFQGYGKRNPSKIHGKSSKIHENHGILMNFEPRNRWLMVIQ